MNPCKYFILGQFGDTENQVLEFARNLEEAEKKIRSLKRRLNNYNWKVWIAINSTKNEH
jgi:hypothetical protein